MRNGNVTSVKGDDLFDGPVNARRERAPENEKDTRQDTTHEKGNHSEQDLQTACSAFLLSSPITFLPPDVPLIRVNHSHIFSCILQLRSLSP